MSYICLLILFIMELIKDYIDIGISNIFGIIMLIILLLYFKENYIKKES